MSVFSGGRSSRDTRTRPPRDDARHSRQRVARPRTPYRVLFDARLALTLRHHGVTELATCNTKDFQGYGFTRVWDPLAD